MKHQWMVAAAMAFGFALAANDSKAQEPPQQERYFEVVAEPADGGLFDYDQPGTGITLTKVTKNLFYGLYYGYEQDGRPMWRNFLGEFIPEKPVNGQWARMGTLKAKTFIATGGQVLGQPWREQVESPAPEGDIEITFHSARKATISYAGSTFNANFPQVSHAAIIGGRPFGFLDAQGDHVEIRLKVQDVGKRFRNIIVTAPVGEDHEYRPIHYVAISKGDDLFKSLCAQVPAGWTGDLIGHLQFDVKNGLGTLGIAEFDPAAQTYVLRKQLATLVAARDGVVFHGKTCEGLDLEGVILPNRSQMVYFDLADE